MLQRTIRVLANPFHALDAHGAPACAIQFHDSRDYIGARKTVTPGPDEGLENFKAFGVRYDRIVFEFTGEMVELRGEDAIRHVKAFAKTGELLPADEETAKILGVAFRDPKTVLADERERAIALFTQQSGAPPGWAVAKKTPAKEPAPSADAKKGG